MKRPHQADAPLDRRPHGSAAWNPRPRPRLRHRLARRQGCCGSRGPRVRGCRVGGLGEDGGMSEDSKVLPVKKWYVRFERIHDEALALDAWRQMVRAQGWSPVGDPEVGSDGADPFVIGKVVRYPGLTVSPAAQIIVVP